MAKCEICGKGPQFGHNVSHSNRKTNRQFRPNIQRVKVMRGDRWVRMYVCTQCIRTMSKEPKVD